METINSTANTLVVGTAESDSIVNYGEHVTINAGEGDNFVRNGEKNQTVDAGFYAYILTGAGNDNIENHGRFSTIYSGDGNDSIHTDVYGSIWGDEEWRNVTVFGGAGDDILTVNDNETSLNGGAGNDIVSVTSSTRWSTNTLQGGTGDDTLFGSNSNVFFYSEGDGYDVVYNFANGDTVQVNSATPYYYIAGNDPFIANTPWATIATAEDTAVIVGTGGMLLKNGLGKTPNVSYGYSINVDLTPLTGAEAGVFVVSSTVTDGGDVIVSSDATLKVAAEASDIVVGYVTPGKVYVADSSVDKLNRQNIIVTDNCIVSATPFDDTLNITGNNAIISGGLGKDTIAIGESVNAVTLVDIAELQNGSDKLTFARQIVPGTLQRTTNDAGVVLYTINDAGQINLAVTLAGITALDESLLNCEVSNAGKANTIRELLYGEVSQPILNDTLEGRIMFAQWGYGFTPPEGNPLFVDPTLATSADLAEDFGSPTLDEIAPANFAVTPDNFAAQNFNADFSVKQAEKILALSKPKF